MERVNYDEYIFFEPKGLEYFYAGNNTFYKGIYKLNNEGYPIVYHIPLKRFQKSCRKIMNVKKKIFLKLREREITGEKIT